MKIKVHLFASLAKQRYPEEGFMSLDAPEGATVEWVLERLSVGPRTTVIPLLEGEVADKDQVLEDGDTLKLFPVMGGG